MTGPQSNADRQRAYRRRQGAAETRGPAPTQPHGTLAAFRRHQRAGETPCDPCRLAYNAAQRERYALRARPRKKSEEISD